MAFSRTVKAAAAAFALSDVAQSELIKFKVQDSNFRPTEFRDGLPTYVKAWWDDQNKDNVPLFLLCTSCRISYIFGEVPDMAGSTKTVNMSFNKDASTVPVNFVSQQMSMYDVDDNIISWTQEIGFISPEYQSSTYFDVNYNENMFGLAPSLVPADQDQSLLNRQFLYAMVNTEAQKAKGMMESYSFNGGELFLVGGTQEEFENEVCD